VKINQNSHKGFIRLFDCIGFRQGALATISRHSRLELNGPEMKVRPVVALETYLFPARRHHNEQAGFRRAESGC
jgi:hypothetical protein